MKDVERVLGLTNYFRKYILGYGAVFAPISDLRRKNAPFMWSAECQEAAVYLKKALSEEPLLTSPESWIIYDSLPLTGNLALVRQ